MTENGLMNGKVVMVTGATDGIGEVTARELAGMGATTIIVGRNQQKAERVVDSIKKERGNSNVDYLIADLSSQAEVRKLAGAFRERYDRLDVLVNNAGAVFIDRKESVDGIEMTWALNHFQYFLLTNLLLDVIKESAPARIVNVSSGAHFGAKIKFDRLKKDQGPGGYGAYGQTKLANLYFTYELAKRLDGSGVTVNAVHPGFVASKFGKNNGGISRFFMGLAQVFAKSPEEGAETSVYLASSPEVEGVTGKYFTEKKPAKSSDVSYDEEAARKLWEISEDMTGLKEPQPEAPNV